MIKLEMVKNTKFYKVNKNKQPNISGGATCVPSVGDSFMYIETNPGSFGSDNVFVSWERTDIIQTSVNSFYFNRFSILTNDSNKSMGRFRIQLLLGDNTWSTQCWIRESDQFSDNSTDWTLVNLIFTVE